MTAGASEAVTTLYFPNTLTTIGNNAFLGMSAYMAQILKSGGTVRAFFYNSALT